MSGAWGDAYNDEWAPTSDEWVPQSSVTVSNGVSVMLNNEVFRKLTHHPAVVAAICERAQQIVDLANTLAVIDGAEYTYTLQNRADTTRARCRVKPGNMAAVIDDNYHGTLIKALNSVGSDPVGGHREGDPDPTVNAAPDSEGGIMVGTDITVGPAE